MRNQPHHDQKPHLLSMKMLETPATAPMFRRKIQSNITDRTIRMYEDASRGGTIHSESLLASVANSALHYSQDCDPVDLPGGYGETRYRVAIEFLETTMGSTENLSYITGYTDHMDCSDGEEGLDFPPEMRFYFNELRTVATRRSNNIRGTVARQIKDTSQILTRIDDDRQGSAYKQPDTHLMTPAVVTQVMQADVLHQSLGLQQNEIEINDSRTSLMMHNNYRSQGSNRVRSTYMTRVLDGYSRARMRDLGQQRQEIGILADAIHHSGDASIANSRFFEALLADTDYDFNGYVTWRELQRCFPEIRGSQCDIAIHPMSQNRIQSAYGLNNVTPWNDGSLETMISNITVSGIPAMMPDLLLEEITFTAHNDTEDGSIFVLIDNFATMYDDLDRAKEIETLENRIRYHLYSGCDFVDNVMFHVQGTISTQYACDLAVSIDDAEEQVYNYPNYASALATSLVSSNQEDVYHVADDMRKLLEVVKNTADQIHEESTIYIPPTSPRPRSRGGI